MIVTLPVICPGRNDDARRLWVREDRTIPYPIVIRDLRIDPAVHNVVVHRVSFQSCYVHVDEPWCIAWVTLEVPDGTIEMPFEMENPKLMIRPDPLGDREKMNAAKESAARIKGMMANTATTDQVAAMHASRMANSVINEVAT